MKALRLLEWQHDAALREVDQPEPGPGEVLIRIGGAGACHSDLHLMHDFAEGMMPWGLPFTLGHENAGWVEALGPGVAGVEIDEPVAVYGPWGCGRCRHCLGGAENYCEVQATAPFGVGGLGVDGGMAEYMIVPSSRHLIALDDLDPIVAAPLTDAGLTPYHAIKRSLGLLTPGSAALVIGAGGLGHMAIQILAALTPTKIVVVDSRAAARDLALQVGADGVVEPGSDAADAIRDLTGGRGVDVTLDLVGVHDTLALGAAVTRALGHLTIVGIGGGTLPVNFFSTAYEVSVATTYWGTLPELAEVISLAHSGYLVPDIHQFALDEAPDVYQRLRAGDIGGRAVIVP